MASTLKKIVLLSFLLFQILVVPVNSQLDSERTNPAEFVAGYHLASTESYATVSSNAPEEENLFIDAAECYHASASELADHARRPVTKVTKQAAEEHQRLTEEFQKEPAISSVRVKASKASAKNKKKSMAKEAAKLEEDMHIPTYRFAHAIEGHTNEADILGITLPEYVMISPELATINQAEQLATKATQEREEHLRQADKIQTEVADLQQLVNALRSLATLKIKVNLLQSGRSQSSDAYDIEALLKTITKNVIKVVEDLEHRHRFNFLYYAGLGRDSEILHELRKMESILIRNLEENILKLLQQIERIQELKKNIAFYNQALSANFLSDLQNIMKFLLMQIYHIQELKRNSAFYGQALSATFSSRYLHSDMHNI